MSKKAQLGNLIGQRSAQTVVNHDAHAEIVRVPPDTGMQETVNTETKSHINTGLQAPVEQTPQKKKKATFDMDPDLHTKLKIYAASRGTTMVEVIEDLLRKHIL